MKLNVLTMNIMVDGVAMTDPVSELTQIIEDSRADVVILSESNTTNLLKKIVAKAGGTWAGARAGSSAILSRRGLGVLNKDQTKVEQIAKGDVVDHDKNGPAFNGADGITALVEIASDFNGQFDKQSLIVSSVHPSYRNYAAYLPRGYDGNTWQPLADGAVTDINKIRTLNLKSGRKSELENVLSITKKYESLFGINMTCLIAGDFNEPSGFDWSEGLKTYFGHHGVVYDWDTVRLLRENGYVDTFHRARLNKCGLTEKSPQSKIDECIIKHPGVTWQSRPPKNAQGHWGPCADDRDRLDFIFVRPSQMMTTVVNNSVIVGDNYYYGYYQDQKSGTSVPVMNDPSNGTPEDFLTLGYPQHDGRHFPSDHRGVMTTLDISFP